MNNVDLIKDRLTGVFGVTQELELLSGFVVQNYPVMPLPVHEYYNDGTFIAIGVGKLGAELIRVLYRNLAGIECYAASFDLTGSSQGNLASMYTAIRGSDLLFLFSGMDDNETVALVTSLGVAAIEAGCFTIGIVPDSDGNGIRRYRSVQEISKIHAFTNTLFPVSECSWSSHEEQSQQNIFNHEALAQFSMRHIATIITKMVAQRNFICVEFKDIKHVLNSGKLSILGIGVANSEDKGNIATLQAKERLEAQGINIKNANSVLTCIEGSSLMTIDDYDDVSRTVHESCNDDATILIGLVINEELGSNIRVNIIASHGG